jgi:putative membrane protein
MLPGMHRIGIVLAAVVALLHVYIFVLEGFLWTTPYGRRVFANSAEKAETTKVLAVNQAWYNLLLTAGIIWGLCSGPELLPRTSAFLLYVAIVGVVGAVTASKRIFFVQTVPAVLALAALWLGRQVG